MGTIVPWFSKLIDEDKELLGDDWWVYGMEANRKMVETFLCYHFEQGITARRFTIEDIFVLDLLNT
ncbi:MAG TPA: hypothetical protein VGH55_02515 [Chthoniobacterales bacterium]